MKLLRSALVAGIAKKVIDEARKPHNQAKIKQAEFMEREAKIYYHTYSAIQDEVLYYCKVKNVSAVISYNSDKADINSRQSIMRAMTNTVVACNPRIDITDVILRVLNRNQPQKTTSQGNKVPR